MYFNPDEIDKLFKKMYEKNRNCEFVIGVGKQNIVSKLAKVLTFNFKAHTGTLSTYKEQLEIIIFRGYSSSTTHPIEIDSEKKVITLSNTITNFKLYKSPLTETEENFIRENQNSVFFLNQKNWI